jgi:transcriptional regulator with XRE-family HTH domain
MQRFGEKLRALRERQHMSQRDLAQKLGFSGPYLHRLETGQKHPNTELVIKVARFFNVSTDALLLDERELEP